MAKDGKDEENRPPVLLDEHRGMAAQVATDARRHLSEVEADQEALRQAQAELESFLFARDAASWPEAAEKAKYLIRMFAATPEAQDPRNRRLIEAVIEDFRRLAAGL